MCSAASWSPSSTPRCRATRRRIRIVRPLLPRARPGLRGVAAGGARPQVCRRRWGQRARQSRSVLAGQAAPARWAGTVHHRVIQLRVPLVIGLPSRRSSCRARPANAWRRNPRGGRRAAVSCGIDWAIRCRVGLETGGAGHRRARRGPRAPQRRVSPRVREALAIATAKRPATAAAVALEHEEGDRCGLGPSRGAPRPAGGVGSSVSRWP